MSRHLSSPALLAIATAVLAGGILFVARASAGGAGHEYRPGMMGGGAGSGMTGGYHGGASPTVTGRSAALLIRHQYTHCHTWSLNGGPFETKQSLTLRRGATLTVINDDVMSHRLVKLAGGGVTMRNGTTMPMMGGRGPQEPGLMNHMGAATAVTFAKAGVYRLRTRAGADYMPGVQTSGADNALTLRVKVL